MFDIFVHQIFGLVRFGLSIAHLFYHVHVHVHFLFHSTLSQYIHWLFYLLYYCYFNIVVLSGIIFSLILGRLDNNISNIDGLCVRVGPDVYVRQHIFYLQNKTHNKF